MFIVCSELTSSEPPSSEADYEYPTPAFGKSVAPTPPFG